MKIKYKTSEEQILDLIYEEIISLKKIISHIPDYINLHNVAEHHSLSYKQVYRKVIESGDFEPDVDYIKENNEIKVSKTILHLLGRQRRPKTKKGGAK